jgi:hypothetical protein
MDGRGLTAKLCCFWRGDENIKLIVMMDGVQLFEYTESHWTTYFIQVNYIASGLYSKKAI